MVKVQASTSDLRAGEKTIELSRKVSFVYHDSTGTQVEDQNEKIPPVLPEEIVIQEPDSPNLNEQTQSAEAKSKVSEKDLSMIKEFKITNSS